MWELAARVGLASDSLDRLIVATEGWSGRDLVGLFAEGGNVDAMEARARAFAPSTLRWLEEARDAADRDPLRGRVDDLVAYLDRYRLR